MQFRPDYFYSVYIEFTFRCNLAFRYRISAVEINPEIIKPVSSTTPNLNAAVKPIMDHRNGITRMLGGHFFTRKSSNPKVNMVVGQGNPIVGEDGYMCPMKYPMIG